MKVQTMRKQIDPDLLPLTAEAIDEEHAFNAAQVKAGGNLRRIQSGYLLAAPGVIQHFADSGDMRIHVFQEGRKQNQ